MTGGTGEDADPQFGVGVELLPGVVGTDEHLPAERVAGVRPVQGDGENVPVALDEQVRFGHGVRLEHVPVLRIGPSVLTTDRGAHGGRCIGRPDSPDCPACCSRRSNSPSSSRRSSSAAGCCDPSRAPGGGSSSPPATCSTRGGIPASRSCSPGRRWSTRSPRSPSTARPTTVRGRLVLIAAVVANLGGPRLLQVLRLLPHVGVRRAGQVRSARQPAAAADRAAGRHLVLHVPGPELRDRHVPRRHRACAVARLRRLPLVLPAPRRRADRAGARTPPAAQRDGRIPATSLPRWPSG